MMIAQTDLPSVPDATLKWTLIVLVAIVLIACAVYAAVRKPGKQRVKIEDDPAIEVRKAPKRFNHDLAESRHQDHERRILELEVWRRDFGPRLEEDRRELILQNEERASRIHAHIEKDRVEMDRKIEGIFDRIIATLRNMGKI